MLTLCGFAASNYHNKVKLALLEKGVPFEEELAWVGATDASASPLGKVPYLKTPDGAMCESAVMLEYIEQKYPQNPLIPADPFAAAKVRVAVSRMDQGNLSNVEWFRALRSSRSMASSCSSA
jgi:glutathione S-transferase